MDPTKITLTEKYERIQTEVRENIGNEQNNDIEPEETQEEVIDQQPKKGKKTQKKEIDIEQEPLDASLTQARNGTLTVEIDIVDRDEIIHQVLVKKDEQQLRLFFETINNLGKVSFRQLEKPEILNQVIQGVLTVFTGKRKITATNIRQALSLDDYHVDDHTLGQTLHTALNNLPDADALILWDKFSTSLQHKIIIVDDSRLNIDLIDRFEIAGATLQRAAFSLSVLKTPENGQVGKIFSKFTETTGEGLVMMYRDIIDRYKKSDCPDMGMVIVCEMIESITSQQRLFLFLAEMSRYVDMEGESEDDLWTIIESNDIMPESMYFANFLQNFFPKFYYETIQRVRNEKQFWEERAIEVQNVHETGVVPPLYDSFEKSQELTPGNFLENYLNG